VLLLVGIRSSRRDPTAVHPFGHGKAQFFYAFLVSVLLFGIAGWESLNHGVSELRAGGHGMDAGPAEFLGVTVDVPLPVEPFWVNVAVLAGAVAFESYAFLKARAELRRQIRTYDWSGYREAFERTSDLTTLTAFTEDTVALIGLSVALVGVVAARVTGNPVYDAAGAVVIGVLLMLFAVALALENRRLILGESMGPEVEARLRKTIESHDGVAHVDELRTMFIGPARALVTADVSFASGRVAADIDADVAAIERSLKERDGRVEIVYIETEA
jgi:cation diffusion facilitator family transporter